MGEVVTYISIRLARNRVRAQIDRITAFGYLFKSNKLKY